MVHSEDSINQVRGEGTGREVTSRGQESCAWLFMYWLHSLLAGDSSREKAQSQLANRVTIGVGFPSE